MWPPLLAAIAPCMKSLCTIFPAGSPLYPEDTAVTAALPGCIPTLRSDSAVRNPQTRRYGTHTFSAPCHAEELLTVTRLSVIGVLKPFNADDQINSRTPPVLSLHLLHPARPLRCEEDEHVFTLCQGCVPLTHLHPITGARLCRAPADWTHRQRGAGVPQFSLGSWVIQPIRCTTLVRLKVHHGVVRLKVHHGVVRLKVHHGVVRLKVHHGVVSLKWSIIAWACSSKVPVLAGDALLLASGGAAAG
ncbi:hypothetical protein EYF80_011575 [Liparis tanakae]|uniref:Uncharacterized protein n=1 Tax=Liparis tanakae TaxID=230148 RepID=A0A4Z2IJ70_9TELE|nr:hypothetical protein EYF80_011575 [Liparis tanakae]